MEKAKRLRYQRGRYMTRCCILLLALVVGGCGQPLATIKTTPARYAGSAATGGPTEVSEEKILAAEKSQDHDALAEVGKYLAAADSALRELRAHPADAAALRDYDFALARVFSAIHTGQIDAWSKPLQVPGYVITQHTHTRELWNPVDYEFTPCDELTVGGSAFHERARRVGLGATLLATRKTAVKDFQRQFLHSSHLYYGVTAVATFEGNRCEITFKDPLEDKTVAIDGQTFPLAGDFSTSVAAFLVYEKPEKLGITRLLYPDKYGSTTLLYRLQPYHPDKIPVLFVHGLQDSSATWMPMFNSLLDDPEIRDAYQFWFFTYPSGYPFPYAASLLRHDLDEFDRAFPDHKPIVIVGHSMGGLLTHMMLTDSGKDAMWHYLFNDTPEEAKNLTPDDRKLLESVLIFEKRHDISRAIFLSTPHRGAKMAENWIGKIGTKLVHLPQSLLKVGADMSTLSAETKGEFHLHRMPNSIDTLSPTSSFVVSMNQRPMARDIPYHQIMGDRGLGNSPNSSDGVVGYWSSHLDGAQSTCIVPSGHKTHQNAEGIAEVRRILKSSLHHRSAQVRRRRQSQAEQ